MILVRFTGAAQQILFHKLCNENKASDSDVDLMILIHKYL